jgi:hypothetical protein
MPTTAASTKVTHVDLPTLSGQPVTIRFTNDESEKRGIVSAYDSVNKKVRINQGKRHFWVPSINTAAHTIRVENV